MYFSEGSVPPSDPAFPTAVTRSGGRACGSVLVQLRSHFWSKSPHCSPSPDSAAQQDGLSCANWIALPETRRAEALQKRIRRAPTAGTISVHTARLELVGTPWNLCDVDTGTSTLQHGTLLCVVLPARASRAVPPPFALLRGRRQAAGRRAMVSVLSSGLAPVPGLLRPSTSPSRRWGGEAWWETVHS